MGGPIVADPTGSRVAMARALQYLYFEGK